MLCSPGHHLPSPPHSSFARLLEANPPAGIHFTLSSSVCVCERARLRQLHKSSKHKLKLKSFVYFIQRQRSAHEPLCLRRNVPHKRCALHSSRCSAGSTPEGTFHHLSIKEFIKIKRTTSLQGANSTPQKATLHESMYVERSKREFTQQQQLHLLQQGYVT